MGRLRLNFVCLPVGDADDSLRFENKLADFIVLLGIRC